MKPFHAYRLVPLSAILFCLRFAGQAAEDPLKVLSSTFKDLRAAPVVSLHGWNHKKKVMYVYEREVKASTAAASVKNATSDFLTSQKWIFRPDLGEPIGTGAAIHLTFKNPKGSSITLSMLAYSYLVISYPDDSKVPHLWFSVEGKGELNNVFWPELFEKYSKEWKVGKIEREKK